jgi:AraC-like DNA-binding protein
MIRSNSYSTTGIEGQRSVDAWRQAMAEVYYRLEIKPPRADSVRGELLDWQSGTIGISSFKADAQRVIRHGSAAKADKTEDFVFIFPTRKALAFEQRGREGLVQPGHVLLLNAAEPYIADVLDGSENITIKIDRERLVDRCPGIDDLCATGNFANPLLVSPVVTLGEQVLKLQSSAHASLIQDCVVDLLCLMLECRVPGQRAHLVREALGTSLFNGICAYIRQRLADHSLTPERAAADNKISVRYLHRIFQLHGRSFGQVLLEERLQLARLLIVNGGKHGRINLGEVAFRCGFASQSHFSVSYKRRFGVSPRHTSGDKAEMT